MYRDHQLFQQPSSETKIWRYLNKQKIFSLIEKESLFFARVSSLKDPFEGRYPINYKKLVLGGMDRFAIDRTPMDRQSSNFIPESAKDSVYICCFTMNDFESDVLWKAYLQDAEGVAIQLTLGKLKNCFDTFDGDGIYIGKVNYLDYKSESFNEGSNLFSPFLHKRVEYTHEHELRGITTNFFQIREKTENGVFIPISLQILLEKIVLSPNASKTFEEKLISLCLEKQLGNIVVRSTLEEKPKW